MLPDFPDLESELNDQLTMRIKAEAANDPILSQIPSFRMHEGRRAELFRQDGTRHEMTFDDPVSGEATVSIQDVREKGAVAVFDAAHSIAKGLQRGMAEKTISTLRDAVEGVGNAFDAKGEKLSADMLLQMWERMQLSFDRNGKWQQPTMVVHSDLADRARSVFLAIEEDPELRAKRDAIINRQRDEWRVREARRKLAD